MHVSWYKIFKTIIIFFSYKTSLISSCCKWLLIIRQQSFPNCVKCYAQVVVSATGHQVSTVNVYYGRSYTDYKRSASELLAAFTHNVYTYPNWNSLTSCPAGHHMLMQKRKLSSLKHWNQESWRYFSVCWLKRPSMICVYTVVLQNLLLSIKTKVSNYERPSSTLIYNILRLS